MESPHFAMVLSQIILMVSNPADPQKIVSIKRFDGGMSDDIREPAPTKFSISKHFDIYSNPWRLSPYRDVASDSSGQVGIGNFLYSSMGYLLGLGLVSGQNWPQIYYKQGANMLTDAWNNKSNWIGTGGTTNYELFIEYNKFFYFWKGGALVKGYIDFSSSLLETYQSITTTYRAQGFVHAASNMLYIPYSTSSGTFIASIDSSGIFTAAALTLPSNYHVASICDYGTFLAIACLDTAGGNSKVVFWDLSSAQVTQIIDWGADPIYVLNNVEGALVGISSTLNSVFSLTTSRVTIRRYAGGFPLVMNDLIVKASASATIYPNVNFVRNNRLYFSVALGTNVGLFAYGRKGSAYPYGVTMERFSTNDNSETSILAAILLGDVCWTVSTSAGTVNRTNDQASFAATSIYESQIFSDFPSAHLDRVMASYVSLPSSAKVVMKYRKDADTDWTAIFRDNTSNSASHNATKVENNSDAATLTVASPCVVTLAGHNLIAGQPIKFNTTGALPTGVTAGTTYYVISTSLTSSIFEFSASVGGSAVNTTGSQSGTQTIDRMSNLPDFKEIQFRLESTGGAEILGFLFVYSPRKTTYG